MVAPNTPPITDAQAQRLLDSIGRMTLAQRMSDAGLSDAAIHAVCCLSQTEHYEILSELICRFDRCAGIVRDGETGDIVKGGEA